MIGFSGLGRCLLPVREILFNFGGLFLENGEDYGRGF